MNPFLNSNEFFKNLFVDETVEHSFSTEVTLEHYKSYEIALIKASISLSIVESQAGTETIAKIQSFVPDMIKIGTSLIVDGLAVPEFVRQLKEHVGPNLKDLVHCGVTSQDVMDTTMILVFRDLNFIIENKLREVSELLEGLSNRFSDNVIDARTRMQLAMPIRVEERINTWIIPLREHLVRLSEIRYRLEVIQFGGPVGTRECFGDLSSELTEELAKEFGLGVTQKAWHSMRSNFAEYAGWLSLITGSLGKMGLDLTLMAQQGIGEVDFKGGGTSSSMPHKSNPVLLEILTSFADFNALQLSGVHSALVHEQERSGRAWTLETMSITNMLSVTVKSLSISKIVLSNIERVGGLK
jgi:3-carboxy-cis,cis-muconate cycloisomerase